MKILKERGGGKRIKKTLAETDCVVFIYFHRSQERTWLCKASRASGRSTLCRQGMSTGDGSQGRAAGGKATEHRPGPAGGTLRRRYWHGTAAGAMATPRPPRRGAELSRLGTNGKRYICIRQGGESGPGFQRLSPLRGGATRRDRRG